MVQLFTGDTAEGRDRVIAQEPGGRMGRSDEIAAAVLWLSSDAASFAIGHALAVDGGTRSSPRQHNAHHEGHLSTSSLTRSIARATHGQRPSGLSDWGG